MEKSWKAEMRFLRLSVAPIFCLRISLPEEFHGQQETDTARGDLDGSPCRPAINLVQSMMRAMRAIGPSGLSGLADMKLPALAQCIH
jgi:hypothetical protein